MNKIFKVKWNAALKRFDVTSELTKGKTKSSSDKTSAGELTLRGGMISLSALLMALGGPAQAADIDLDVFNSKDGGHVQSVTGTDNLKAGSWNNIARGDAAVIWKTFAQALQDGDLRDYDGGKSLEALKQGNLATGEQIGYDYYDKDLGSVTTFKGYDNGQIKMVPMISTPAPFGQAVGTDGQYVDRNLIQVNSGGKLDVSVGDSNSAEWFNNPDNRISAFLKGNRNTSVVSSVFKVDSASTLDYKSKTVVNLGNQSNQAKGNGPDIADAITSFGGGFAGDFTSAIGQQTVNNVDDLKKYNSALIAAVQNGTLPVSLYEAEFNKARNTQFKYVFADKVIDDTDAARQLINTSRVAYILGDNGSTVNIADGASIQGYSTDISMVRLVNNSTLNNYGDLGSFSNSSTGSMLVSARNSVINNYGVLDAGTNPEMAGYKVDPVNSLPIGTPFSGSNRAITANGATVNNVGVINIAPNGSYSVNTGVWLDGASTMINSGSINVAAVKRTTSPTYSGKYTIGVQLLSGSSLTNDGTIYMGREAQRKPDSATADIASSAPDSRLVDVVDQGTFVNNHQMTLGSLTQGAYAVVAKGTNAHVTNNGDITLSGKAPGVNGQAPLQNVGVKASGGATDVVNASSGNIILDGINAVAMVVTSAVSDTVNSALSNMGTITIKQGIDPTTKTANYGLWAEGSRATATNAGTIDMQGDGAIGAHARNGGTIKVDGSGYINFGGKNQTGYYVFGAGSKVVDDSLNQSVTTEGSTLYRIDGGASFDGSGNTSTIDASGKNSTALLVTSNGAASQLNSGNMTLAVSGEGATGVKVMGSAQGTLSKDTVLTLSGSGSSAGIVDGNYSDITGSLSPVAPGAAKLTSYATLDNSNATGTNVIGYIARNGGTLDHQGSINFTTPGATGVLVDGGTLLNNGEIHANGIAVDIQGDNSTVTNNSTVEATDGTAAFRVGNGAHLDLGGSGIVKADGTAHGVLLSAGAKGLTVKDATIDMTAAGTGNGIENAAEVAGIQLNNTTINVGNGVGVRTAATLADTNSGTINVKGSGTGIYFGHADGSATTGDLDTANSAALTINVSSAAGRGIVTNTSGDVKSGASVNVNDAAGGAALVVGGSTRHVEQSGKLTSKSLNSAVVDVDNGNLSSFINRGDIIANSAAQEAIKVTLGSNINFTNAEHGHIQGKVALGDGNNSVTLEGGSLANDVITGSGNDNFYLDGISEKDVGLFSSLQAGAGSDTLNFNRSSWTVTDPATLTGFEQVSLTNGSALTLDNTLLALGDAEDDGVGTGYKIDGNSTLKLKGSAAIEFASHLSGAGTVATDLAGNALDFTSNNASNNFTGTLALNNATLDLGGINTQALTTVTLKAGTGSRTEVADGVQHIGGLNFNGGTVYFNTGTPGETVAKGMVQAATLLDISGAGTVEVNAGSVTNNHVLPPSTASLLEQDEGNLGVKLAGSDGSVNGSGGNLVLRDKNGEIISDALRTNVLQDGGIVAKATYDYRLSSGVAGDGLYTSYGLTELDLLKAGADALVLNAFGKTGNSADLSAKVTGTGDLAIDTGAGQTVSLSNMNNDYRGKTDVRSGTLLMNNDNVLGKTSELALAAATALDMNGHSQTVGALNTAATSGVNLNGGALSVTHGGKVNGRLLGAGALQLDGGTLTVNGSNDTLSATTTIAKGAEAQLNSTTGLGVGAIVNQGLLALKNAAGDLWNNVSGSGEVQVAKSSDVVLRGDNSNFDGKFTVEKASELTATRQASLGSAAVVNDGMLNLASDDSWTLGNSISGNGALTKDGSGMLTLTQDAARYTGNTSVNGGSLLLGSANAAVTLASARTDVAKGALFGGFGGTAGSVNNAGTLVVGAPSSSLLKALPAATAFNVGGNLTNSGNISVGQQGSGIVGNNLNVAGDYKGDGGRIHFNTALGGDNSKTDHMTIGGATSGTTAVSVSNAGGSGAKTINGIELINVKGASEGNFTQDGRIVAGAYDYKLTRGKGANAGNWYLTSGGDDNVDPVDPVDPTIVPIVRPESGEYASNMAAANTLFNTRLHDRLGESHYVDALTGETKVTSMWLRNVGGHTRSSDSSGQLHTQANRWVTQLGGDVAQWSSDGADRFHLGLMAGYANQHSSTRNNLSGHSAKGSINGYSTGIYGTWLQDNAEKTGAYVDSWAQYSWFNNTVSGDTLRAESYKSSGFTASVESGYTWKIGEKNQCESYYIQPKAQVTWMGVKADSLYENNGTRVSGTGDGNVQTRLGVRAFIKGHNKIDDGKQRTFEPFVEANWIANTKNFGSTLNGVTISQSGTKNIGELKVGVEGQINPNLNLWGNIGQQMGDKGYSDSSAMVGVKVNF